MTDYQALLKKLFALRRGVTGRRGLENIQKLSGLLNRPERSYPVVHIAGSNGKGSVATKIANTLGLAGYKVGLYTSPHIVCFSERILVQGLPIPEEEEAEGLRMLFSLCETHKINPTFFELATILGFHFFHKQQIDIAIVETGLGGRLDATNIVQPLLCVITSLSKEHTALLGSSLEEIAQEKAGILKPEIPVVLGPYADCATLRRKAAHLMCPVTLTQRPAVDFYDEENQEIARCALNLLKAHFPKIASYIQEGIRTRPSCRFEKHQNVLLDVAHNPDALERLFQAVRSFYPFSPVQVIIGLSDDKDKKECLRSVAHYAEHIYLVEADTQRATPHKEMAEILQSLPYLDYSLETSVASALAHAQDMKKSQEELIVICGSFYLMKEAKEALLNFPIWQ